MDITYTIFKLMLNSEWAMMTTHQKISKDQDSGSINYHKQMINHHKMTEAKRKNQRRILHVL